RVFHVTGVQTCALPISREAAAIAARIQQTEAEIAGHEAQSRLIGRAQALLRTRLAARQQPVVRLTAALQRLSRRPPVLALLRPEIGRAACRERVTASWV